MIMATLLKETGEESMVGAIGFKNQWKYYGHPLDKHWKQNFIFVIIKTLRLWLLFLKAEEEY